MTSPLLRTASRRLYTARREYLRTGDLNHYHAVLESTLLNIVCAHERALKLLGLRGRLLIEFKSDFTAGDRVDPGTVDTLGPDPTRED